MICGLFSQANLDSAKIIVIFPDIAFLFIFLNAVPVSWSQTKTWGHFFYFVIWFSPSLSSTLTRLEVVILASSPKQQSTKKNSEFFKLPVPLTVVSRGDWLGNPANIKVENIYGAVVYVGISLTVHNPLFSVHKLWLNKLMQLCFYWSITSKWWECYWTLCTVRSKKANKQPECRYHVQ